MPGKDATVAGHEHAANARVRGRATRSTLGALIGLALLAGSLAAAATPDPVEVAAVRQPRTTFSDVPDDHRFAAAITWLVERGITTGRTPTSFDPDGVVTRGQMAVFLWRLEEQPAATAPASFDDVAADAWNAEAVAWLVAQGITRGITDDRFGGELAVTRAQMASFLWRLEGNPPFDNPAPFVDVEPDSTHANAIAWLVERGITRGVDETRFAPNQPVTRGQMAAFLYRLVEGPEPVEPGDPAPPPPPGDGPDLSVPLRLVPVADMTAPTAGAVGPDGTLYLAERGGTIHPVTTNGIAAAVIDLSAETTVDGERGLLGVAFAADGSELYVSSTALDGATTLTAFGVVDGEIQPEQRRLVYRLPQPFSNHNGGDVQVGPDGLVYLAIGDGGGGGDPLEAGQDLTTALGSIIRIDPLGADPYRIPDDNPFVDRESAAREIFAYGLRNPWRFSFDPPTDTMWIADVGQSDREEINRVHLADAAGANFGWNLMEGTLPFAGEEPDDHVPPIYEYVTRSPEGCAITGGVVYRGNQLPELDGVYLYADFCVGEVRGLVVGDDGTVLEQGWLGIDGGQVIAFVTDPQGEVLVLSLDGRVQRIERA